MNLFLLSFLISSIHCEKIDLTWMQVLWNSGCLDSLLFSVRNETPSTVINDPACAASIRSLYQKVVREWIIISLSYAPCTSQGLLQVNDYSFTRCQ